MAKPLIGPPKLRAGALAAPMALESLPFLPDSIWLSVMIFLGFLPLVSCTETKVAVSGRVWPLGNTTSLNRRLNLGLSFRAAKVFSSSDSATSPSTRAPAGITMAPLFARTGSLTVAVKRSPGFEVLLKRGVSSAAWISVPTPTSSITAVFGPGGFCEGAAACPVLPCGTSAGEMCVGDAAPLAPLLVFGTVGFCVCGVLPGLLLVPAGFWAKTVAIATSTNRMSVAALRIIELPPNGSTQGEKLPEKLRLAQASPLFAPIQHLCYWRCGSLRHVIIDSGRYN